MIAAEVDAQWQADLVAMQQFSKHNSGVKHILMVIDILCLGPGSQKQNVFWSSQSF